MAEDRRIHFLSKTANAVSLSCAMDDFALEREGTLHKVLVNLDSYACGPPRCNFHLSPALPGISTLAVLSQRLVAQLLGAQGHRMLGARWSDLVAALPEAVPLAPEDAAVARSPAAAAPGLVELPTAASESAALPPRPVSVLGHPQPRCAHPCPGAGPGG
jgi:hypothetical protein